ncbi:Blue light-induced protein 4 [Cladobotryum mycophilum]|uniref:Blue light-induced protein 4 n=1 Tax=Cladobotryum mycophilum TaxID=491253 RepID=A0ABR0SSU0_9HYPO
MQSILHKVIGPKVVQPQVLTGRVAVVTGGALGIGYEVSRALAHAGCKVIMVNRKEEQGSDAISKIKEESLDADVDWKGCDLGNLSQVKNVFSDLRNSLERLDFLVLSAGINANTFALDSDGIDRHFGVNYLGQYFATNQLWPLIRKTSMMPGVTAPRIVAESSELHRIAPSTVKFQSLEEINDDALGPTQLYARSKLALILMMKYGLVHKVIDPNSDSIFALSVHPGAVNTAMQDQWKDAYGPIFGTLISWVNKSVSRDAEQGSYSALWALTAPDVAQSNQNGFYYTDPGQLGKESSQASNPELGTSLWNLSERLIKEKLGDDALIDWNQKDYAG